MKVSSSRVGQDSSVIKGTESNNSASAKGNKSLFSRCIKGIINIGKLLIPCLPSAKKNTDFSVQLVKISAEPPKTLPAAQPSVAPKVTIATQKAQSSEVPAQKLIEPVEISVSDQALTSVAITANVVKSAAIKPEIAKFETEIAEPKRDSSLILSNHIASNELPVMKENVPFSPPPPPLMPDILPSIRQKAAEPRQKGEAVRAEIRRTIHRPSSEAQMPSGFLNELKNNPKFKSVETEYKKSEYATKDFTDQEVNVIKENKAAAEIAKARLEEKPLAKPQISPEAQQAINEKIALTKQENKKLGALKGQLKEELQAKVSNPNLSKIEHNLW